MESLLGKEPVKRVQEFIAQFDPKLKVLVLDTTARTAKDAAHSLDVEVGAIVKSLVFRNQYVKLSKETSISIITLLFGYLIFPFAYLKLRYTKYQISELQEHKETLVFNKELIKTTKAIKLFKAYNISATIALVSYFIPIIVVPAYLILKKTKITVHSLVHFVGA